MKKRLGFTFIEILVVVTIIGIISAVGTISYSSFIKQSRDAKRKGDIEQIRAAVEMYKSNNDIYPVNASGIVPTSFCDPGGCAVGTYLSKSPTDPVSATYNYYYYSVDGSTYAVGAYLEQTQTGTSCGDCFVTGSTSCNYCMGPYGQL